MSDELVKWLRGWDHCWPAPGLERAVAKAADRIVTLAAERDEAINQLDSAIHSQIVLEKRTAAVMEDRKLILEERDRTFALMLTRVEKAEAERDRQYEENVHRIAMQAEAEAERDRLLRHIQAADEYLDKGLEIHARNVTRAALKGETP